MREPLRPLYSADAIARRVRELGARISADFPAPDQPLHFVGVLVGACFFTTDLARSVQRDVTLDFVRVSSYDGTESAGQVRLVQDLSEEITGRDVVVVEDIADTGHTLAFLLETLRAHRPRSLRSAALLNKKSRRTVNVAPDYVGFEIPDAFVVGYGLDYNGRYRNRRGIYVLDAL